LIINIRFGLKSHPIDDTDMVDRCICFNITFAELKAISDRINVRSLDSLQQSVDFGLRCGLCKPYVERMLETGRVVFPVIRTQPDYFD
jgi:bacterioferritin-associated ferredoxin